MILVAGLAEWTMRRSGHLPARRYFSLTTDVVVEDLFYTDDTGIFRTNPAAWEHVPSVSVNSEGFRSPEFVAADAGGKSLLLIGDSHAWGIGASPFANSFADLVRADGYRVYNTGIPGVGPSQYRLVADQYVPKLKPSDVIVALYAGNDLQERLDPVMPRHNLIHVTNAGWILGFDACGQPLTAQQAYDYYIGTSTPVVQRLLLSSAIGTAAWNLFSDSASRTPAAPKSTQHCADGSQFKPPVPAAPAAATFDVLRHIADIAAANGSRFHLLVIPSYGAGCNPEMRDLTPYRMRFDRLNPIYLDDLPESAFLDAPDCHMRNEGHRIVADRIEASLKSGT